MRGADHGPHPSPGGEGAWESAATPAPAGGPAAVGRTAPPAVGRRDRGPLPRMARWRWHLFRLLARLEASEADYFDLPANRHVQVEPPREP